MTWVTRYDVGTLQPPITTDEGFLRVTGYASRVGVFEYVNADGTVRRELRLPEDVFHPDSLKSYEGRPFTNNHPGEPVTKKNARVYQRGTVLQPGRKDGDHVAVDMMITDEETIRAVNNGKRELSSGYRLRLEKKSGVHPVYGRYDAIQRDIRINHLALVDLARAGQTARLRIDGKAVELAEFRLDGTSAMMVSPFVRSGHRATEDKSTRNASKGAAMPQPKNKTGENKDAAAGKKPELVVEPKDLQTAATLLAQEKERADELAKKLEDETKRADAAEGSLESVTEERDALKKSMVDQSRIDELDQTIEGLQAKVIELEKERDDALDPERLAGAVRTRVSIIEAARPVLGDDSVNFDEASDKELMVAVIEKLRGVDVSERSDDFIQARFEDVVAGHTKGAAALARIRKATVTVDADGARSDANSGKSPREIYLERQRTGWKPGASGSQKGA